MKLYKNGVCVYKNPDAYIDSIKEYICNDEEVYAEMYNAIDYVSSQFDNGFSLLDVIALVHHNDFNGSDYIFDTEFGTYVYPYELVETDSDEAVQWWMNVLNEFMVADWKIERD